MRQLPHHAEAGDDLKQEMLAYVQTAQDRLDVAHCLHNTMMCSYHVTAVQLVQHTLYCMILYQYMAARCTA
jgi:hypothetical protein